MCEWGGGHLVDKLRVAGKTVYSTDLIDRGHQDELIDFLESSRRYPGDIITNPPYRYCTEFILKALDLVDEGSKVAMFLKLTTLEGAARYQKIYKNNPPVRIHVYSKRIQCSKNGEFTGGSAVCYAWFIWEKGFKGKTEIDWIF